jgi:hypothetical protein
MHTFVIPINRPSASSKLFRRYLLLALVCCWPMFAFGQSQTPNPVPLINWINPPSTPPGGMGLTISVFGSGFMPGSTVYWNGLNRSTTFVNTYEVTASISALDTAVAATASITVINPAPGGGDSNVTFFSVTNPTQGAVFGESNYVVGQYADCAVVADFNGDGNLDLAVGELRESSVSILLGNGDGTFGTPQDFVTGTDVRAIAVGDFNGDGNLDLATANNESGTVSILLGQGDGTFLPKTDFPVDVEPKSIAVGDFNKDGILDLAVVNHASRTVSILLGNGDGSFAPKMDFRTDLEPYQVVTADFNLDGNLDLAVVNYGTDAISIFLGKGDGTFGPEKDFPVGDDPMALAVGDFNGDGIADLAAVNEDDLNVSILLGVGDGTFSPQLTFSTVDIAFTVGVADFNGDGKPDIAVRDGGVLLGNGEGMFGPRSSVFSAAGRKLFAAVGDFNGDGRLDMVSADINQDTVYVFLQVPRVANLPEHLSFKPQAINTSSKPTKFVLKNTGSALLQIEPPSITGDFSQTNDCGSSLAAETECTFQVTFTPTTSGTLTGSLTITHNASGSPHTVNLTGTGE